MTLATLKALAADGQLTVLAGAGISHDPPSCLPLARELLRGAAEAVSAPLEKRLQSAVIAAAEALRPETFAEILLGIVGPKALGFLSVLASDSPNANHKALAAALKNGGVIATTNFDTLIEQAAAQVQVPIHVVVSTERLKLRSARIYKLHGTLTECGGLERLALSSGQVARRRTGALRKLLQALFRDSTVLVVGYSGMDDFDINPLLASLPRGTGRVVWIDHVGGASLPRELEPLDRFTAPLELKGAAALLTQADVFLRTDTTKVLSYLFGQPQFAAESRAGGPRDNDELWRRWAQALKASPFLVCGHICLAAGDPRTALQLFTTVARPSDGTLSERVRFMLGAAASLRRLGRPVAALKYGQRAVALANQLGSPALEAEAAKIVGQQLRVMSRWRDAAHTYLLALRRLRNWPRYRAQQEELTNALAIALDKLGKSRSAFRLLEPVAVRARQGGRLDFASRAFNNLGLQASNLNDHPAAEAHLEESLRLKRLLSMPSGIGNTLHNLAWLALRTERISHARCRAIESIRAKRRSGSDRHGIAQSMSLLAQAHLRLGRGRA
jgi:tetratricopeptide (TPR) repeat protein